MDKPWRLLSYVMIAMTMASCGSPPTPRPVASVPVVTPTPEPKPDAGSDIVLSAESEAALATAAAQKSRINEDDAIRITPASKADPAQIDLLQKLMVPDPRPEDAPVSDMRLPDGSRSDDSRSEDAQPDAPSPLDVIVNDLADSILEEDEATAMAKAAIEAEMQRESTINQIIWQIQSSAPKQTPEASAPVTEGPDPSLADDALNAAFALLANKTPVPPDDDEFVLPAKDPDRLRVALMAPLSGRHKQFGEELRKGAELALFTIANPKVEMLVYDTAGGDKNDSKVIAQVAAQAMQNGADIIIGPLFTESVEQVKRIADFNAIPMIVFSNNVNVAGPQRWVMGYLPEQQLDSLLGFAVADGRERFAILAESTAFGKRLANHAKTRLQEFGFKTEEIVILSRDDLADETMLKRKIRNFARYQEPKDDEDILVTDAPYDAVVFAGGPSFALRTAPVLAYYDVGPDNSLYLGTALWNQNQLLSEPSLQGGIFAKRPSVADPVFEENWAQIWPHDGTGQLARLGFDAMALVSSLTEIDRADWTAKITDDSGFNGYSGAFRLQDNGSNLRAYEIRRIWAGKSDIIQRAPGKI
ncbi:penicillin-binding protein activator [Candidatus Puniceispirillum marinum]|uniref:ABC-type branched-chain amino acid transport systems, periplasmic component n=1 Tax=Puniceispirillum marinum (strain IMCC1322) TaxID=488538 RepID=D5BUB9_PUNMI|nr:penicillin-binding protein activator [Candidatus Puniceispirillum marinum]ADE39866.1 ABC-type branched-chain amino acid transport systems, periplasmic component [Candidatus Puniceispirillum marinum IMCC1322]